jgi:hypothetical protein
MQYMQAQIDQAGTPAPLAIGIDEISVRKGHTYRIVVSDLHCEIASNRAPSQYSRMLLKMRANPQLRWGHG